MTTQYPFNFSAMQLGQHISQQDIQHVYPQLMPGTDDWNLQVLAVRGMIEKSFSRRLPPRYIVVVAHQGGLLICDDSTAAAVTARRARLAHRRQRRNFRAICDVDRAQLTPVEATAHDQLQLVESKKLHASKVIDNQIKLQAAQRLTPARQIAPAPVSPPPAPIASVASPPSNGSGSGSGSGTGNV